jgi:hypothetical protein
MSSKSLGRNLFLKAALSVGVAFHLFCIFLVPNSQNYVGYIVAPIVEPYIRMLSLSSTWGFFAPDPGPPPLYIEYEALSGEGATLRAGRWPDRDQLPFFRERRIWRVSLVRSLASLTAGSEQIIGPYLCKLNPDASTVRMWKVVFGMPTLLDVRDGKRTIGDEVDQDRRLVGVTYCDIGAKTEVHAAADLEGL